MKIPCKTCLKYPVCLSDRSSYILIVCPDLREAFSNIYDSKKVIYHLDKVDITATQMANLYNETWYEIYRVLPELERKMSYDSLSKEQVS